MLKEIVKYLEGKLNGFKIGVNLFGGFCPSTIIADRLVVIESGGTTEPSIKDYMEKTIQVLSIAADYFVAQENAMKAYNVLHAGAGIGLATYVLNAISAISAPQSLGQDEKGRFIISTNYILRVQDA